MGMKKTGAGLIPEEWEARSFSEVFRILNSNTFSRAELNYDSGEFKNVHYGDVLTLFPEVLDCTREDLPFINADASISGSAQPLQDGDVVIADTAEDETVGKATEVVNTTPKKVMAGLHTIPCRVKACNFAFGWLGYYMNSHLYHDQLLPYIHGIKVSSISKSALGNTTIIIPPIDEQEKIVGVLADIDVLIDNLGKQISKYKAIKRGCLQHMFPRKGQLKPDMRLPGFTDDWEQRKLEGLAEFNPKSDLPEQFEYVDLESVVGTEMIAHRTEQRASAPSRAQRLAQTGDLFYQTVRPYQKNNHLFEKPDNDYVFSTGYAQMRPYCDGHFLLCLVQTDIFLKYVLDRCTGTSYPAINANDLAEMSVHVPISQAEQEAIGKFFANLDHLITLHQRKLEKYKMIKQGMMEELLTGNIRL